MPTFDMVVVGCGGGPSECNLSSYLLKPCDVSWDAGIVALEAGSGIGALSALLRSRPDLFGTRSPDGGSPSSKETYSAAEVYSWIRCYLVSHAHLDHVIGLVLSAGALGGEARRIYAAHQTLKNLECIFSDRLWPGLASWNPEDKNAMLVYSDLHADGRYQAISADMSAHMMPISHGPFPPGGTYQSTAFFVRHDPSSRELLFFGDVEPDSLSALPRNREVWREAAPKVPYILSAIFIECSYPLGRTDDVLYGHLNPEHLVGELVTLAKEVVKARKETSSGGGLPTSDESPRARKKQRRSSSSSLKGALNGLRVYVIHCKEDLHGAFDEPINLVIADQVRSLVDEHGLGAEVIAAEQGMQICI